MTIYFPADFGEDANIRFHKFKIAGLQFYEHYTVNQLSGDLISPNIGDRLELVREPSNRHDTNAIEVRFCNGQYKLGHVPAVLAEELAPLMDQGHIFRAYAITKGVRKSWSIMLMVCGDQIPEHRHNSTLKLSLNAYNTYITNDETAENSIKRAEAWVASNSNHRKRRMDDALHALAIAIARDEASEPGNIASPTLLPFSAHSDFGKVYGWWDHIPKNDDGPQFRTKTQWQEDGYKIKKGEQPTATIEYGRNKRARSYNLYNCDQVIQKPLPSINKIAAGIRASIAKKRSPPE